TGLHLEHHVYKLRKKQTPHEKKLDYFLYKILNSKIVNCHINRSGTKWKAEITGSHPSQNFVSDIRNTYKVLKNLAGAQERNGYFLLLIHLYTSNHKTETAAIKKAIPNS